MEEKKLGRRQFLKQVGTAASLCLVGKGLIQPIKAIAETNPPKKALKLIDENKNMTAKSLKFMHDGSKNPARKDPRYNCGNCQMYRKQGEVDGVEVGRCNVIGGGYVKITGWCTSWVRNPKVLKA